MPELLYREKMTTIICESIIFWLVIQLHGASTAPFAPINGTLRNIVDCAVTDAVSDLTMPVPVDTDVITSNIITKLISGGIEDCFTPPSNDTCKSRGEDFLVRRFQMNGNCATLEKITLPAYNRTTHYSAYVLKGNTSCLAAGYPRYDSDCFPGKPSRAACSWTQTIKSFGEDHFPELGIDVNCDGNASCYTGTQRNSCYYSENTIEVYGLKREKGCDSDGYEIWRPELLILKIGCNCLRCQRDWSSRLYRSTPLYFIVLFALFIVSIMSARSIYAAFHIIQNYCEFVKVVRITLYKDTIQGCYIKKYSTCDAMSSYLFFLKICLHVVCFMQLLKLPSGLN